MCSDYNVYCNFVKASERFCGEIFRKDSAKSQVQGTLSGSEAKEFYNDVVSSTSNDNDTGRIDSQSTHNLDHASLGKASRKPRGNLPSTSTVTTRSASENQKQSNDPSNFRETSKKEVVSDRLANKYLQHAQNGDINEVQKLLSGNVDIDVKDQFGWTAVMCASYNGHTSVVRYLLSQGASWRDTINSKGQTALDLAKLAKQKETFALLDNWDSISRANRRKHSKRTTYSPFWCSVCQQEFTEDQKKHRSSTVHQFNCQHRTKDTHFSIPGNNPGYQIMVKSGWDEETGLGPEGEGRKYPIKTVLKRDRYGLGSSKSSKPRVTHFGPHDESAVKRQKNTNSERKESQRTLSKKQKRVKESKEKAWERNMRLYMNS